MIISKSIVNIIIDSFPLIGTRVSCFKDEILRYVKRKYYDNR